MLVGTFRKLETLTLREGFLAKEFNPHLEVPRLSAAPGASTTRSMLMSAGRPQDYGRVVANTRLVEIVDKALAKD